MIRLKPILDTPPAPRPKLKPVSTTWTGKHVGERLIEAYSILQSLPGRVGPRDARTVWPEIARDLEELQAAQEQHDAEPAQKPNLRYSPAQMSAMEAALSWPSKFLPDPLHCMQVSRVAFLLSMGKSMDFIASRLKRPQPYLHYKWLSGLGLIAEGLTRGGDV